MYKLPATEQITYLELDLNMWHHEANSGRALK